MRRKYTLVTLIGCCAAILPAAEIRAQNQGSLRGRMIMPASGMPGKMIRVSMGIISILNNEKVQKELELSDEQKTKVAEAVKESSAAMDDSLSSLTPGPTPQEMQTKIAELVKKSQDKLMEKLGQILQPKQLQRLKEIQLQVEGPMALLSPDVIKALDITEEQQKEMKTLNDVYQKTLKESAPVVISMQGSNPDEIKAKINEMQEIPRKMKQTYGDFLLKVLTQDQRDKFEKMQGAKTDIDLSTPAVPADSSQGSTK
ncbi:MAG: hypothetical protein ABSG67_07360 [Thermoguttaceae bacterium]|jgi:hypothetical protein